LINPSILRDLEVILLRNRRWDKSEHRGYEVSAASTPGLGQGCHWREGAGDQPSTDEVSALEMLHERFGSRETDEDARLECAADTLSRRTVLDTPRRWRVDRGHRELCLFHGLNDSLERLAHFSGEAEAWWNINTRLRSSGGY
jgi:hypothetical protein